MFFLLNGMTEESRIHDILLIADQVPRGTAQCIRLAELVALRELVYLFVDHMAHGYSAAPLEADPAPAIGIAAALFGLLLFWVHVIFFAAIGLLTFDRSYRSVSMVWWGKLFLQRTTLQADLTKWGCAAGLLFLLVFIARDVHAALWNKMMVMLHAMLCVMWMLQVVGERTIVTEGK
jgi:hypothetical protein